MVQWIILAETRSGVRLKRTFTFIYWVDIPNLPQKLGRVLTSKHNWVALIGICLGNITWHTSQQKSRSKSVGILAGLRHFLESFLHSAKSLQIPEVNKGCFCCWYPFFARRYYFPNSGHVMFSLEFAYCLFISYVRLYTWIAQHSLWQHHMVCNGKTKRTNLKGLLLASVHITKVTEKVS